MIFPKHITKTVGSGKNYLLQRQFGEEEWCIDRLHDTIETTSPFVIVSKGRNVLLTSRIIDAENTECEYVALTKKKPTRAAYTNETEKQRKIIVMPTGTGKTETMLSILIAAQCRKLVS